MTLAQVNVPHRTGLHSETVRRHHRRLYADDVSGIIRVNRIGWINQTVVS